MKHHRLVYRLFALCFALWLGLSLPAQAVSTAAVQPATPTPYPTLPPEYGLNYTRLNDDQFDTVNQQFDIPGCEIPCLWGMTLGQSRLADLYTYIERLDFFQNLDEGGFNMFSLKRDDGIAAGGLSFRFDEMLTQSLGVSYYFRNDVLYLISLTADSPARWQHSTASPLRLSAVLANVDAIPEIYIFTGGPHQLRTNYVLMDFLYRREGIRFRYVFDFSNEWDWYGEPLFRTCPGLAQTDDLNWWFWDTQVLSAEDYLEQFTGTRNLYANYPTIDQVLGVSAATFVEYFRKYPDGCIESVVSSDY